MPLFLRPPLAPGETEETRKNLRLESIHGHVHADITLVDDATLAGEIQAVKRNRRVLMHMKSTHGGITAKIVSTLYMFYDIGIYSFRTLARPAKSKRVRSQGAGRERGHSPAYPTHIPRACHCTAPAWLCTLF